MTAAAAAAFALPPALALGSFLNVVAVRVPAGRSLLHPPSSCGSCGHEIGWRDTVPVLSYLLLRGRCRHCDARFSALYPLVEATTAALIVVSIAVFGLTGYGLGAAGFLFVAALAHPKGLGLGDVKLALVLGAMLGGSVFIALMVGFVSALV